MSLVKRTYETIEMFLRTHCSNPVQLGGEKRGKFQLPGFSLHSRVWQIPAGQIAGRIFV